VSEDGGTHEEGGADPRGVSLGELGVETELAVRGMHAWTSARHLNQGKNSNGVRWLDAVGNSKG